MKSCLQCAIPVDPEAYDFNHGLCDRDYSFLRMEESKNEKQTSSHASRLDVWLSKAPLQYRENSTHLIDVSAFAKVLGWKYNHRGILCMGDSRRGKTTSCWKLIEKLFLLENIPFEAMSEPEFSQFAAKNIRSHSLDVWLDKLCACKLLFLDDIGHAATTGKHLEELYYVIEKRTSWKRPIIATTQFTGEELASRAKFSGGEKTVQAILNRLKESCEVVIF